MKVEKKLFHLRKKNNMSQEQLAKKLGVSRQTISRWENGDANPDLEQTQKLSKIFHEELSVRDISSSKKSKTERKVSFFQSDLWWNSLYVLTVLIVVFLFVFGLKYSNPKSKDSLSEFRSNSIESQKVGEGFICSIDGKKYFFSIQYDDSTGKIIPDSASSELANIIDVSKYHDVTELFSDARKIVLEQGGTCG